MRFSDYDIDNWPNTWKGMNEDTPYGKKIIGLYKPFIIYLKESSLAPKSINRHINYDYQLYPRNLLLFILYRRQPPTCSKEFYIHNKLIPKSMEGC